MEEIVDVSLSGHVFSLERRAYDKLNNYLRQINISFANSYERHNEVTDIESRIVEIIFEQQNSNAIITSEMIDHIIEQVGIPYSPKIVYNNHVDPLKTKNTTFHVVRTIIKVAAYAVLTMIIISVFSLLGLLGLSPITFRLTIPIFIVVLLLLKLIVKQWRIVLIIMLISIATTSLIIPFGLGLSTKQSVINRFIPVLGQDELISSVKSVITNDFDANINNIAISSHTENRSKTINIDVEFTRPNNLNSNADIDEIFKKAIFEKLNDHDDYNISIRVDYPDSENIKANIEILKK